MPRSGNSIIVALALLFTTSGCGSLANLRGNDGWLWALAPEGDSHEPFGGVCNDVRLLVRATQPISVKESELPSRPTPLQLALLPIDLPLCVAVDIVTLPWMAYVHANETVSRTRSKWLVDQANAAEWCNRRPIVAGDEHRKVEAAASSTSDLTPPMPPPSLGRPEPDRDK